MVKFPYVGQVFRFKMLCMGRVWSLHENTGICWELSETILVLKKKNGVVRSIDIANDLGVSKPSVSVAMKNLRNGEYIEMDKEGYITLLDKGREIAEKIYERRTFLTDWLTSIGVDPTVAAEDACRIEHVISAETFTAMKKALKTK